MIMPLADCDLIDRFVILTIKQQRFQQQSNRLAIEQQLQPYQLITANRLQQYPQLQASIDQLTEIHSQQWDLEARLTAQLSNPKTPTIEIVATVSQIRQSNKRRIVVKNAIASLTGQYQTEDIREQY